MDQPSTQDNLSVLSGKLRDVIDNSQIRSVFQPIVSLQDGSVLGFEALSRGPAGTQLENPETMFTIAAQTENLWDLERLCADMALSAMQMSGSKAILFLNINPNIIENENYRNSFTKEILDAHHVDHRKVVFEITETNAVSNSKEFRRIIQSLKGQDYIFAIDDAGAGYAGLNMISDVHPEYIKLDIHLIRDIDKDNVKQALVKSMYEYANITGTYLIAEGIETRSELETLIDIGVHYGQGYYIQRPAPYLAASSHIVNTIIELNAKKLYGYHASDIGNLCIPAVTADEALPVCEADKLIKLIPGAPGICVTRGGVVRGVVTGDMIDMFMAQDKDGLGANRCVGALMDKDFLEVDVRTPASEALNLAMSRSDSKVYDFITVVSNGKYKGIVTVKDLLKKAIVKRLPAPRAALRLTRSRVLC